VIARAPSDLTLLLANQARGGAFPACPSFSQYPYSWLRDSSFVAYALDRCGEHAASGRYHSWAAGVLAGLAGRIDDLIARRQAGEFIPEGHFLPTRFALSGEALGDDWPNFQLDGYGQWLWALGEHLSMTGVSVIPSDLRAGVDAVVRYLRHFWNEPCYDCWEEFPYRWHTSTLASLYGGLCAITSYYPDLTETTETIRDFVLKHCVSNGALVKFAGFPVPDASLLWASVPFGLLEVEHPVFQATLAAVERDLWRDGLHRYQFDTYYGGGSWLLLTAWLGWVYARLGRRGDAQRVLAWVVAQDHPEHGLPEQTQDAMLNPAYLEYWRGRWGEPARPLLWSHAMRLVLEAELSEGNPA
jgi:GH15 family glucan-1,4-alpha-glucosidase